MTSTSIYGMTSTSTDDTTSTSIDGTTSTSTDGRTSTSIDGTTSTSMDNTTSTSMDAESPIPPDRSMHISSYIEVLDEHQHVEASQRGLRFRDEVDKGPAEEASIDTDQIPSNDINKPAAIDATTSPSIDTGRESEQKEFDVCGDVRDGDTTTRSDKSEGKKRRNWKKRKRIKDGPQVSLILRFSNGVRKSRVRNRCLIDYGFDPFSYIVYSILEIFGASTRDDHRARKSVDIGELESIDTHNMVSIDSVARRKPVWSQPT
ncbi:hypothetical protein F2Q69_00058643 [Brassica cretica]|uniref:Uncharacterized protein n=1 Tax=Brassica cretica TaxID=69181 RepID=A0A8S9RQ46_BRACR|nr:hypothetical protein F2Q69_00058643 [Brassica cretica]